MTVVVSSESLDWPHVIAEVQTLGPGSGEVASSSHHEVTMHVGRAHPLWERFDGRARQFHHREGDVMVAAAGERRELAWNRPTSFFRVRIDASFVRAVAEHLGRDPEAAPVVGKATGRAPDLERTLRALRAELERGTTSEAIFVESLTTRLALLLLGPRTVTRGPNTLSSALVGRVMALIHDRLATPLSLTELADAAGLSAFHFARAFRTTVGVPPHRYVVDARVDEARRLILTGSTIADAATSVGFHSQGHLTRHMKRLIGVTPGELARRR